MRTLILLLFLFTSLHWAMAQDTFSIVAVDPQTGEVGSAGATCVDGIAQWGGIQLLNKIIPGKGGVNAQAWICLNPHINLDNAMTQMANDLSPQEIIDWLIDNDQCSSQNFNPQYRQYGVADLDENGEPRVAAFTGSLANDYKGHITGPNYAIQGNILLGPQVLEQMEAGFLNTPGSLADKLMGAMQGANIPGADSRCLGRGTSSTSAFLRVVQPDDDINNPFLELNVLEMPFGEEPIDSLQTLFDEWLLTSTSTDLTDQLTLRVYPNPAQDLVIFELTELADVRNFELELFDLTGKKVYSRIINGQVEVLNREEVPSESLLIYRLYNPKRDLLRSGKLLFVQ